MASPPLAAAAAGSGVEASSGSEETGTVPPDRDLAALFEQAAERLPALLPTASKEQLLYLYARFKQMTEKRGKESKTAFGGPVVSSLYQEETIREEDKNIFDYCRENNIDYVTKAIQSKKVDVNAADEEGRALLHWACDRGHKELVTVLLQHAADVNSQDGEGQTALHYAAACEFLDIVELLLKSGANPTLRDQEGCLPEEVTDCKAITSALQQHTAGKT
ncbi:acyl-CoA-binding domain-containing protein 6 isoform X2 [Pezoporus wallicus]|uniref:acyl-CoA-binding domain-containing protein 6 isoform X2 n=1 Tax=Pezoporus wallicus TaxID=35540 RepID=UPI00254DD908|nr:acyl-CoA-binding domain-containing protein 6 isoform X2 [Pezoporus wallicus]XP_061307969.1 acyl-CoA-binding domain-containing protein 6 isoform X3 [Pezoporus flaviventris]